MPDSEQKTDILPQRLCSEIQLFDLCDLDSCHHKNGRFCTNPDVLERFEKIADEEIKAPQRYLSEEIDGEEEDEDGVYDDEDELDMNELEPGEDDGWEDDE